MLLVGNYTIHPPPPPPLPYNPFTPKSVEYKISPAALPEILHHTVWRTWLFIAYSGERWLSYQFSVPRLCNFFNLGVKELQNTYGNVLKNTNGDVLKQYTRRCLGESKNCSKRSVIAVLPAFPRQLLIDNSVQKIGPVRYYQERKASVQCPVAKNSKYLSKELGRFGLGIWLSFGSFIRFGLLGMGCGGGVREGFVQWGRVKRGLWSFIEVRTTSIE